MRLACWSRHATAGALFAVLGSLSAPLIASAQPAAQKLTIALASNINTLDPDKTNTVGTDLSVIAHIYTPLVDRGSDMKLRPGLATSWTAVNDTTWRFVLKPGVTFPDGEKLDAAAVKWNVDRILDPKTGARNRPWFDNIADVKVVSPTELEFITKSPYPDLPAQMTMFFLMAPKWTAQNNPAVQAMGTGPYTLQSYAPGNRVVLRARDGGPGPQPQFQQVTFHMIRDDAARVAALRAGEVDFISVFPTGEVKRLSSIPHIKAGSVAGTRVMFVKLNATKAPFKDNPMLWQALSYAVDKQGINAALLDGQGQIAHCQPLSPAYFGYNPDLKPIPYDPAKAKALLAQAGFLKGLSMDLEVPTGRYIEATDIAQIVAAELGQVGVKVNIREMDFGAFMNKMMVQKNLGDSAYFGLGWPTLDAAGLLDFWQSTNGEAFWNDKKFDDLAIQARSTTDAAKRQALYRQATAKLCASPTIFMFFPPITYAERDTVSWQPRGDDWVRAMDMTPTH